MAPAPPRDFIKPSKPPSRPSSPDRFSTDTASLHRALHPWLSTNLINPKVASKALDDFELTARQRAQIREERRRLLARQRADKIVLQPPVPRDEWPSRAYSTRPRRSSATSGPISIPTRDRRATVGGVVPVLDDGDRNEDGKFSIWTKTLRKDSRGSPSARRDTTVSVPATRHEPSLHYYDEDAPFYRPDLEAGGGPNCNRASLSKKRGYGTLTYFPPPVLNEARREARTRGYREVVLHFVAFVILGMVVFLGVGWIVFMAEWDAVEGAEGKATGLREGWVSMVGAML